MKIEFEISKEQLKKDLVNRLAELIWKGELNGTVSLGWGLDLEEVMKKKARKLISTDKEFDKKITKHIKDCFEDKDLREKVVSEIIKDKLGENKYY